jgi:hypothetical protein
MILSGCSFALPSAATSPKLIGIRTNSTDDGTFHSQQLTKHAELARDMADADRAMVRWALWN